MVLTDTIYSAMIIYMLFIERGVVLACIEQQKKKAAMIVGATIAA